MQTSFTRIVSLVAIATVAACAQVDRISAPVGSRTKAAEPQDGAVALFPMFANAESTPGAVPAPVGLRACFAGEGNALDVVSGNVGVKSGAAGYVPGRFGLAFNFDSLDDGVAVPPDSSLDVGVGPGLTMSAWILARGTVFQDTTLSGFPVIHGAGPIIEFDGGAQLWHHSQQHSDEALFTNIIGPSSQDWHILTQQEGLPYLPLVWHHTAVTYDKASGWVSLYIDGAPRITANFGSFSPRTSQVLRIGKRGFEIVGGDAFSFNGALDEVQLYERALTDLEIAQLASATGTMCVPPPTSFQVSQMPVGSGESGVPFATQPVVEILDANGDVVSNATTAVTATASGDGFLTGTTTITAVSGVATFTDLAVAGAGNTTISFSAGGLTAVGSTTSPALATVQSPSQLVMTTQPDGAVSGSVFSTQPQVTVLDAAGLPIPGATVSAAISSGDGTLIGTTLVAASGIGVATFTDLQVNGRGLTTLEFTASVAGVSVTSAPFNVTQVPSQLVMTTQPGGAVSGALLTAQPVVTVLDAANVPIPGAVVMVTVASGTGSLVGTTSITASALGVATFTDLQMNGSGSTTLKFTTTEAGVTVTSAAFNVTQLPTVLTVATQPGDAVSGELLSPPPSVSVVDAAGLPISGTPVTAAIASGTGTLAGTVTAMTSALGVATFTDLKVNGGGAISLVFTTSVPGVDATSATFNISPVATLLGLVAMPTGAESGIAFGVQPAVEVLDGVGNRVTTATGTVTVSMTGSGGSLVGTLSAPIVAGLATFADLQVNGAGSFVLHFAASGLSGVAAPALTVTQQVWELVITSSPATVYNGIGMSPPFVVDLLDAAGLKVLSAGAVSASLASGNPTLSGASVVPVSGTATFTALTASGTGSFSLTFSVSGSGASVTSGVFGIVNAPPATQLGVSVNPAGAESGVAFATQPVVRALDAAGNLSTTAAGTVSAVMFSGAGTLMGTTTVPLVGGVATFSDLKINGAGAHIVRFTSSAGLTAVNSAPFTVTQVVRSLAIIAGPTVITTLATIEPPFAVELRDAAGIKVATSSLPVTMTLSSGTGVLFGTATRPAIAGVATFSGMSTSAVGAVTFRFTLVDPTATPPLPTVETGIVTSLYPVSESGFYLVPVDNLPAVNTIEGGSMVPVKFTIGGDFGLDVLWVTNPITSQPASCATFTPTGPAVPVTSQRPNLADFEYNGNKYQLTWVTDKAWDGTCRIFNVRLKDGSNHPAHFIIK